MKITFLGDSITQGVGASKVENCYVNLVGEILNAEIYNAGNSGSRISRNIKPCYNHLFEFDFNLRLEVVGRDTDYIVVFGGTNDYGRDSDTPIGNIDDTDVHTFCGAINTLCNTLIKDFGKEKIMFVLPIHRYNEDIPSVSNKPILKDYVKAEKEVLDYKGIKYLDLFNDKMPIPTSNKNEGLLVDGLHPNDEGHKFLAKEISKFLEEKIINKV